MMGRSFTLASLQRAAAGRAGTVDVRWLGAKQCFLRSGAEPRGAAVQSRRPPPPDIEHVKALGQVEVELQRNTACCSSHGATTCRSRPCSACSRTVAAAPSSTPPPARPHPRLKPCLHGGALPLPADRVADLDVDLGAIKGPAPHVLFKCPPLDSTCKRGPTCSSRAPTVQAAPAKRRGPHAAPTLCCRADFSACSAWSQISTAPTNFAGLVDRFTCKGRASTRRDLVDATARRSRHAAQRSPQTPGSQTATAAAR